MPRAAWAAGFVDRFLGLMGRRELPAGEALVIVPCNSIHMFFMRFALDVVFTTDDGKVLALYPGIKPWRVTKVIRRATHAIETPVGTIAASDTEVGDQFAFEPA
ncbi:MAG: DUF192 domain-containing protein [Myxococcales bacterium]|nr:DUF192 domain-containing protein [Myxococcales bacterium]